MENYTLGNNEDIASAHLVSTRTPFNTPMLAANSLVLSQDTLNSTEETETTPLTDRHFTEGNIVNSSKVSAQLIQDVLQKVLKRKNQPIVLIYDKGVSTSDDEEETVSEEFVNEFNKQIGSNANIEKAERLLKKMRVLGGLEPDDSSEGKKMQTDISSARMGLCMLASLNKPELKTKAIDSLLELLKEDPISKASSVGLIPLTIKLMKTLDRDLIQSEIIETQAHIAEAYSTAVELIQRHYGKKHINALTEELRVQLRNTASSLRDLNRQEDAKLSFHSQCALEGIRRIVDDEKELYDICERFFHMFASAGSSYASHDAGTSISEFYLIFKDLDPHVKKAWYNGMLIFRELGRESMTDSNKFHEFQKIIAKSCKKYGWKYSYAAMDVLTEITLKSPNGNIRREAFEGLQLLQEDLPGLIAFANCENLKHQRDYKALTHFQRPPMKDPNIHVRQGCLDYLVAVGEKSPDAEIRKKARHALSMRLGVERDPYLYKLLEGIVPLDQKKRMRWIKGE